MDSSCEGAVGQPCQQRRQLGVLAATAAHLASVGLGAATASAAAWPAVILGSDVTAGAVGSDFVRIDQGKWGSMRGAAYIGSGLVLVVMADKIYKLDAATGVETQLSATGIADALSVLYVGGGVLVLGTGGTYRVNTATGAATKLNGDSWAGVQQATYLGYDMVSAPVMDVATYRLNALTGVRSVVSGTSDVTQVLSGAASDAVKLDAFAELLAAKMAGAATGGAAATANAAVVAMGAAAALQRADIAANLVGAVAKAAPSQALAAAKAALAGADAVRHDSARVTALVTAVMAAVRDAQLAQSGAAGGLTPGAVAIALVVAYPGLKGAILAAAQSLATASATQTITAGVGGTVSLPASGISLVIPAGAAASTTTVTVRSYGCSLVSSSLRQGTCVAVTPHTFSAAVSLTFMLPDGATGCIKSTDEVTDDWVPAACTRGAGDLSATYTSATFSVLGGLGLHQPRPIERVVPADAPVAFFRDALNPAAAGATVQQVGSNGATDGVTTPGNSNAASSTFLGVGYHTASGLLYYTDGGAAIRSASNMGRGITTVVDKLAHVTVSGANFGADRHALTSVTVKGLPCSAVTHVSATEVRCLSGSPAVAAAVALGGSTGTLDVNDVVVRTIVGASLALDEPTMITRLAEGSLLPMVTKVSVGASSSTPHAICVDNVNSKLFWSDTSVHIIYRANLDGSAIEAFVEGARRVHGLAVDETGDWLYFTDANRGQLLRAPIAGGGAGGGQSVTGASRPLSVLQTGLREPRGVVLGAPGNAGAAMLYFTEMVGRLFRARRDGGNIAMDPTKPSQTRELLLRMSSRVRLDGITIDSTLGNERLYWCEANTNRIRSCDTDGLSIKTVVAASSHVVWPRAIAMLPAQASGERSIVWTHFLGVLSRASLAGKNLFTIVNSLSSPDLKVVEAKVAAMSNAYRFGSLGKILE